MRVRLARRRFDEGEIELAVSRLLDERALDDRRTALAFARTEVTLHQRGPARVLRQLEAIGIGKELARAAVDEVFGALDESALMERALERRLRRGVSLADSAGKRRIYRYLITQGFEPSRVAARVLARRTSAADTPPDTDADDSYRPDETIDP